MEKRFERAFHELIAALEKERARYCVIGALALGAWGQPRTTQDVDVLVTLEEKKRDRLLLTLRGKGFSLDAEWAKANPMIRDRHIRLRWKQIPADLMLSRDAHDLSVLERRRRTRLGAMRLWVAGPEDLILQKLKAGRPRDFEDALSVIVRRGKRLDIAYLRRWARRLGVHDELAYLMRGNQA
jgi:hypothetical protein